MDNSVINTARDAFAHECIKLDHETNPANSFDFFCSLFDAIASGKIGNFIAEGDNDD